MAQISYADYEQTVNNPSNKGEGNRVGYFNLKNDQDEAIVRFAYSSSQEFDLVGVHTIKVGNAYRKINCLRTPHDPLEVCPLCASGAKTASKFFVKLIEYVKDENGQIVGVPKVWERPMSFAKLLNNYFKEYGDLSDCVFKVKRNGVKGDMQTSYDVIFANPAIYKPEIYVKDFTAFNNFDVIKVMVLNKSAEDIVTYLTTGSFPQPAPTVTQQPQSNGQISVPPTTVPVVPSVAPTVTPSTTVPAYSAPVSNVPVYQQPVNAAPVAPVPGTTSPAYVTRPTTLTTNPAPSPTPGTTGGPRRYTY